MNIPSESYLSLQIIHLSEATPLEGEEYEDDLSQQIHVACFMQGTSTWIDQEVAHHALHMAITFCHTQLIPYLHRSMEHTYGLSHL